MKILDYLLKSLRDAAIFNPDVQVAPFCILWPDSDRQWQAIIPLLQNELPQLFVLGDYNPEKRTGPAIWLRCVVDKAIPEFSFSSEITPILYLPGVSRQDLRAIESCPDFLKAIAELQYRGVIWSQINAKDWTVLAFLKSNQGGLNLDVAQDQETKKALLRSLYLLLNEELELLKNKRLDKDYFNTLLTGGDPVRDLLQWLDQSDAFQQSREEPEWQAFVEVCKSQYGFNPPNDGTLIGVTQLANQVGPWRSVWERYCESPQRYPSIPTYLRQCNPPKDIFWSDSQAPHHGWPQWNEDQENQLRQDLRELAQLPTHQARIRLIELEKSHGDRRQLVWTELGESPLAQALQYLAQIAVITQKALVTGTIEELAQDYQNHSWQADSALLQAIAQVDKSPDINAVTEAIRAVYLPWAEDSARHLQQEVEKQSYPGGTLHEIEPVTVPKGECWLFVDGLRFDLAKRLTEKLHQSGLDVTESVIWTALPSVTATGKAAVSPVKHLIGGCEDSKDFEPCVAETGQSLKGGYHLPKLLKENGWQLLETRETGDITGNAWCEFGNIDHQGHSLGYKLAKQIEPLLDEIKERIADLINAGWEKLRIVTDHGWLLLPGGLPKTEMSSALTQTKWSRCAILKQGVFSQDRLFPWFWNPHQQFAFANGVSCFRQGEDYAHGGLSLQECLILELTVISGKRETESLIEITDIVWKGLRCTVAIEAEYSDLTLMVDLRTQPGNPDSSVALKSKSLKENGTASLVVEDESLQGQVVTLVILNSEGRLLKQMTTAIGGD